MKNNVIEENYSDLKRGDVVTQLDVYNQAS